MRNQIKSILAIILISLSITSNAEFVGKAENAAIGMMAILTTYSTKCGDLTPFGNTIYQRIAKDQENKGRLLWDIKEFKDALRKTNAFIERDGLSSICKQIKQTIKATPILNKAI